MKRFYASTLAALSVAAIGTITTPPALANDPVATDMSSESAWLRVEASKQQLSTAVGRNATGIDYGNFQWLAANAIDTARLLAAGIKFSRVENPYVLELGGQRFDPLVSPPTSTLRTSDDSSDWQLIQFNGPVKSEWLADLRESGITPVQYVHPYSYVVWSDRASVAAKRSATYMRWSGHFQTEFRILPQQRQWNAQLRPTMALLSKHLDQARLIDAISSTGAILRSITSLDKDLNVAQFDAPGDRYIDIAAIPGVYSIQANPGGAGPRGEMSNQAITGQYGPAPGYTIIPGYATWLDALGYDGSGVTVAVVDGGVRTTHLDVASRMVPCVAAIQTPSSCTTANDSHGTHVAVAIAGTSTSGVLLNGFLRGQGLAPGANIVQQRYSSFLSSNSGTGYMVADGMLKIYKESSLSGAVLTNNSWGPSDTPQGYDIATQQADMVIRDANADVDGNQQLLNVLSIMNGGGDSSGTCAPSALGSPDEAKNLLSVGSTKMQTSGGAQIAAIFDISSNSAHGNACDGRRVPDIVAPGCYTDSAAGSGNSAFTFMCGTSMASPMVTGSAALFVEKYRALHDGATPSPAMIKAALTAVATDLQGFRDAENRVMGHRPDRFQGYGRLDLDAVVNSVDGIEYFEQSHVFTSTGEQWIRSVSAVDPDRPVKIMLAWTDAKGHGLGGSTPAWVNDLDLKVETGDAIYRGNATGSDGWSLADGPADSSNNLEGIFLRPDQLGATIDISVSAANIAADALHPYVPGDPAQDFALVCYNCVVQTAINADLALSMTAVPNPVVPGSSLDFVATIVNFGIDAANGVEVRMELPAGIEFVSGRLVQGTGNWNCGASSQTVICQLEETELAAGALAHVLEISTQVSENIAADEPVSVTAEVSAPTLNDPRPENNRVTLSIAIDDRIYANGFE